MKIKVRLFGTLGSFIGEYDHDKGIIVEIPDGGTAKDLVDSLNVSTSRIGMMAMFDQKIEMDQPLVENAEIHLFESLFGGQEISVRE